MARNDTDNEQYEEELGKAFRRLYRKAIAAGMSDADATKHANKVAASQVDAQVAAAHEHAEDCLADRGLWHRDWCDLAYG